MSISSVSTNIKSIALPSTENNDIKLIEKQKERLQEQLQKVKDSKMDDKLKQEKVKVIQEQITQANADIQRIRAEQLKQNKDPEPVVAPSQNVIDAGGKADKTGDQVELSSLVQASATYSNIKTMSKIKKNMSGHAEILKTEIKFDEKSGHIAKEKRAEVSEINKKSGVLDEKIGKFQNRAMEEAKETSAEEKADKTTKTEKTDSKGNSLAVDSKEEKSKSEAAVSSGNTKAEAINQQEEALKKAYKKIDVRL